MAVEGFDIAGYILASSALWMCWILVKRRPDIFRKCRSCIFFFFFPVGWKNIQRVAFSQKLTDFHIDSICNWAKTGSGFPPLCKPLLKLIISHSNADSCTDGSSETHISVFLWCALSLPLSLPRTHFDMNLSSVFPVQLDSTLLSSTFCFRYQVAYFLPTRIVPSQYHVTTHKAWRMLNAYSKSVAH